MSESSTPLSDASRFKVLRIYCEASAIGVALLGGLILCGWAFHIDLLKCLFPGAVAVKPNAAVLLALSGISLWLLLPGDARTPVRHIARCLAMLVAMIGAATRMEYLIGVNLHIDQLLFCEPSGALATSFPGRMSQTSSSSFVFIGMALFILGWQTKGGRRPSQGLSLWPALVALLCITSYIYRATDLNRLWLYTHAPMPTAIALFLLSGAIFFARPHGGIAGDLTGEGSGSAMARRLLPAVFLIPILFGWICLLGQRSGLYGTALGVAMYSASSLVVLGVLVWFNSRRINTEYAQRSAAQHDFLTGLPNRTLLNDRINQATVFAPRVNKKVAVLFLDLDRFKQINDSLGHEVGDKLIQSIAKRLLKCVRATDTISRLGGDEFVILLSEMAQSEDAAITARRLLQEVAEVHSIEEHELHVTGSIGVSIFPEDGSDAGSLIKSADIAMYRCKDSGRESYQFFQPAMNVRAIGRQKRSRESACVAAEMVP